MGRLRRIGASVAVSACLLGAAVYEAAAASSCPPLPNAQSTFAGALDRLIAEATGRGPNLNAIGDPVRALNDSQQQKVLGWLREELAGRRAAVAADREQSEAEQKVEDLKKRIFTRDRMERDEAVLRNRIYDRSVDGTALPSTHQGKPLGQIIDEEMARDTPSLASKYKDKYKAAILSAIEADPAAAGEFAGALSAGDYDTVMNYAAGWGAQGFGTIVSDALGELGHENSKVVWDRAVKHADAARRAVLALKSGNTGAAWEVIADEWKKEVKEQGRAAIKAAVDFAFDAGSGAGTIGDFIPIPGAAQSVIAPGTFGLTPGDLYLKLLDAEVALIEWGDNFLRTKWSQGDGQCIRIYRSEFERLGNAASAYEEFDHCISTARYSAMFEFANQAREIGIDETAALKEFLEANRRNMPHSSTPLDWIKARAAAIAEKRKAVGQQIEPELSGVQKVLDNIARGIGRAMDNRLTALASAVLNEAQWDQLADDIRQLEKALDDTLAAIDNDLNRVRRYSGGVDQWCTAYDQQKPIARQAIADGIDLSARMSELRDRLGRIDTSVCKPQETAGQSQADASRGTALTAQIAGEQAALEAVADRTCAAPEAIRGAPDKETARARLEEALAAAREGRAILASLTGRAAELSGLSGTGAGEGPEAAAAAAAAREKVRAEIEAAGGDVEALAGEYASLQDRFNTAYEAMRDAQRRIGNITDPTEEIIRGIKECLRPLAAAPVAERPRAILAELEQMSGRIVGCQGNVQESWNVRDEDPVTAGRMTSSTAWRFRSLYVSTTPDVLRSRLAELDAACPAATDAGAVGETPAAAALPDPDAVTAAATETGERIDRCLADALVAYNDAWGKPRVELSAATCNPQTNAEIMTNLRMAADGGSQEARDHMAALEPKVAVVTRAHAAFDRARQAYSGGQMDAARAGLNEAKAAVDALGGSPDCGDLASRIAAGIEKIDRLERILSEATAAVNSCDAGAIEAVRQRYATLDHPAFAALMTRGEAIVAANAAYQQGRSAYAAGDLDGAEASLRQAGAHLARAGGSACADLAQRIQDGLAQIGRLRDTIRQADQAGASCDVAAISQWRATLATISNPAASAAMARLDRAAKECEQKTAGDRNRRCEQQYGPGYFSGAPDASGNVYCIPSQTAADAWCNRNNEGSGWTASGITATGAFNCNKSPERQKADNDAICRQQFGAGYYAGRVRGDGTMSCLPNRQTANAWCRSHNRGSGWSVGTIKGDGSFTCVQSTRGQSQQAWADCRRQFGNALVDVKIHRNGTYQCVYNTGPRHSTQASAAVAGAVGGIIQGLINRNGGGRSCHHRPATSQQHCGSN